MNRQLFAIILPLIAVILLHDLSMAVLGHPGAPTGNVSADHAHHRPEAPAPEDCGTVRIQNLRNSDPALLAGPDVRPLPLPDPVRWSHAAISDTYLIASVIPPPSACLALFQAFLI